MNSAVLLTSNHQRHRFVAHTLTRWFDLRGIVAEAKSAGAEKTKGSILPPSEEIIISQHFRQRDEAETRYFGGADAFPLLGENLLLLSHGEANSAHTFEWICNRHPDVLLLFGTSIIQDPILQAYQGRIINLHLGLSPYYRGSGTNFWPLVNREPECVGYTIHLAISKVDAGEILLQGRPAAVEGDGCHDLGCKTIIEASRVLGTTVSRYLSGEIRPRVQTGQGRCYWRRHFNAEAVRQMRLQFDSRMMPEYLADKKVRDAQYPIVNE